MHLGRIEQVAVDLAANARGALPSEGGSLVIETASVELDVLGIP
jgi:hypothetical protein